MRGCAKRESEGFSLTAFRIPLIVIASSTLGCDMDDDKPITEQARIQSVARPEATTEAVKTAVKKFARPAKKSREKK